MYQHIFSPDGFSLVQVDDIGQAVERFGYDNIRAGDWVGYYFLGRSFKGFWRKAYVIGMDRDNPKNTIAIVQMEDGTISTFHSECDSLIKWKD